MNYGLFIKPEVPVYSTAGEMRVSDKGIVGNVADQALYGEGCKVIETAGEWCRIITGYGYSGWIHASDILHVSREEVIEYYSSNLYIVKARTLDVLNAPCVQGALLLSIPGGACIRKKQACEDSKGWCSVILADGQEGFVPEHHIEKRLAGMGYMLCDVDEMTALLLKAAERDRNVSGGNDFNFKEFLARVYNGNEQAFRDSLVNTACSYIGTQYRWGGRSAQGLDCSGLVSVSYLRCGVEIYRDAAVVDGFPMVKLNLGDKKTAFETDEILKPGDALYFPGHIAMYLGNGKYIHSTGRAGDNGVVINSMRSTDDNYREDLFCSMYAAAGLR